MIQLPFDTAMEGLKSEKCPYCQNSLTYDVQADSIYVSCNCGGFEVSTFRDKFNGSILLYYLNNEDEGGVTKDNLKQMQDVLYRTRYVKKNLFTIDLKSRIF
jgi:hypothetical protein